MPSDAALARDVEAIGLRASPAQPPSSQADRARRFLQFYILTLPLWWVLGVDFIAPLALAFALLCAAPAAHRKATLPDLVLVCIIVTLGASAYLNGFLLSRAGIRFLAAIYNLAIWICGLILIQQVRHILDRGSDGSQGLLRSGCWAFFLFVLVSWGAFAFAYVAHDFSLVAKSAFGMVAGDSLPSGAVIVKQSTNLVFARPDWGLPGVPMPRVTAYGPYPTATAAVAAVLGAMAVLYLETVKRAALIVVLVEFAIVVTVAMTLTRSILAGWLAGALVANLVFGGAFRRISALGALAAVALLLPHYDLSEAAQYREYSSESRFENYTKAVQETASSNPALGLGIKPREEGNHIPVGSHSTLVSSFTKGGTLSFSLVLIYLLLIPAFRWLRAAMVSEPHALRTPRSGLRILLNLQIAIWVWLCFEDIDAPATAAALIFISLALMEWMAGPRLSASLHAARVRR
jgi:hypothetical protein